MKVYIVLDEYDYSFNGVYAVRENAEEYVRVEDEKLGRFTDLSSVGLAGLIVEEHEVIE